MPPKRKRFKVECLLSHATFDSDYRKKHNELCHSDHLKAHKHIGPKVAGAPARRKQNPQLPMNEHQKETMCSNPFLLTLLCPRLKTQKKCFPQISLIVPHVTA